MREGQRAVEKHSITHPFASGGTGAGAVAVVNGVRPRFGSEGSRGLDAPCGPAEPFGWLRDGMGCAIAATVRSAGEERGFGYNTAVIAKPNAI